MGKEEFIDAGTACIGMSNKRQRRRQVLEQNNRQAAIASAMVVRLGMMTTSLAKAAALGTRKQLLLLAMLDRSKTIRNKINNMIRLTCCNRCR